MIEMQGYLSFLAGNDLFGTLALFNILVVLFGLLALIPVLGQQSFSMRSKVFYLICVFIALGCGAANLAVTCLVTVLLILPCLIKYARSSEGFAPAAAATPRQRLIGGGDIAPI